MDVSGQQLFPIQFHPTNYTRLCVTVNVLESSFSGLEYGYFMPSHELFVRPKSLCMVQCADENRKVRRVGA